MEYKTFNPSVAQCCKGLGTGQLIDSDVSVKSTQFLTELSPMMGFGH